MLAPWMICISICRRISITMDGFCNLYLPMILLMRSGDVETNPGPNTLESAVSEKEFLHLSEHIGPSYFFKLGVNLQIPYAQLDDIKERSNTNSLALLRVFMRWRDAQPPGTNIRTVLGEKLRASGLAELSDALLRDDLISSITQLGFQPGVKNAEETPREYKSSVVPDSKTKPTLSPGLIQRCAEDFKFKYRTTLCKIRADPLNPDSLVQFEDMYTNLVLEVADGQVKQGPFEVKDLSNLKVNGKFPCRIVIQGEAGAGKTTLCAKIAWEWINGRHFQEFKWVLIVPLRDSGTYTIGEIAKMYLSSDNPATASQLTEYIRSNTDKVMLVFDGLDESAAKLAPSGNDSSSSAGDQSQPSSSQTSNLSHPTAPAVVEDIGIGEILQSEKLEMCPVLVTTRPWKAQEIRWNDRLRELYAFIRVEGFSKENLTIYIKKYFAGDEAKSNDLIQFAEENDVISQNMAPYPIYVAMLCLMWKESNEEKQEKIRSLQTFSQIFQEMFVFLKEHYAQKSGNQSCSLDKSLNDRLKEIDKLLEPITRLAFTGVIENTLVFSEEDFQRCPESMRTACRVGLLSEDNRIIPRKGRYNANDPRLLTTIFFPHKLFQEFMASIHLASLFVTDNDRYTKLMREKIIPGWSGFRYLLYFTASQNQSVGLNVLTQLRGFLNTKDREFLVDVAFECQDPQAASLLKEIPKPWRKDPINPEMEAHTVAGYAFTGICPVNFLIGRNCGPRMSRDVAEIICTAPSAHNVSIVAVLLHDNFYSVLAAKGQFSAVQVFSMMGGVAHQMHAPPDFAVALTLMPNLTSLTLERMNLDEAFFSRLKERASFMKLRSLTLSSGQVILTALPDLAEAMSAMRNLTELTLNEMDLNNRRFCSVLKHVASSLVIQTITLSGGQVSSASASRDLAKALCSMPGLTDLTLNGICLQDRFYTTLKRRALSRRVCFPQIKKGHFSFNGTAYKSLPSLLNALNRHQIADEYQPRGNAHCSCQ